MQAQWLEQHLNPVIEKAKQGQCYLFFMDAAQFVLNPYLCAVWCLARLFLKAPAGRQRLNVVGAVQAITKPRTSAGCRRNSAHTYVNAEVIAPFLRKLKTEFADLPLVIVLDNARYQHRQFIEQLASELGIQLWFLTPSAPNRRATPLNIIEPLWKMTKKHSLYRCTPRPVLRKLPPVFFGHYQVLEYLLPRGTRQDANVEIPNL